MDVAEKTIRRSETHRPGPPIRCIDLWPTIWIAPTTRSDIAASRKIESAAGMGFRWGLSATTVSTAGAIIVSGSIDLGELGFMQTPSALTEPPHQSARRSS
jgi:hypothetical protein